MGLGFSKQQHIGLTRFQSKRSCAWKQYVEVFQYISIHTAADLAAWRRLPRINTVLRAEYQLYDAALSTQHYAATTTDN